MLFLPIIFSSPFVFAGSPSVSSYKESQQKSMLSGRIFHNFKHGKKHGKKQHGKRNQNENPKNNYVTIASNRYATIDYPDSESKNHQCLRLFGAGIVGMGFCQLRWETDPKNVFEYVQAFPNDLAGDGGRNRYKYLLKSAYDKNLCVDFGGDAYSYMGYREMVPCTKLPWVFTWDVSKMDNIKSGTGEFADASDEIIVSPGDAFGFNQTDLNLSKCLQSNNLHFQLNACKATQQYAWFIYPVEKLPDLSNHFLVHNTDACNELSRNTNPNGYACESVSRQTIIRGSHLNGTLHQYKSKKLIPGIGITDSFKISFSIRVNSNGTEKKKSYDIMSLSKKGVPKLRVSLWNGNGNESKLQVKVGDLNAIMEEAIPINQHNIVYLSFLKKDEKTRYLHMRMHHSKKIPFTLETIDSKDNALLNVTEKYDFASPPTDTDSDYIANVTMSPITIQYKGRHKSYKKTDKIGYNVYL